MEENGYAKRKCIPISYAPKRARLFFYDICGCGPEYFKRHSPLLRARKETFRLEDGHGRSPDEEEDTEERLHHQQQKRAKTAKNTDTTIERRKNSNAKATTTTSHSSAEPVEIISVFETIQTLTRPDPTIGEVEWISEDLTTTARVKTISRAHPDFTIDLCRKEGQETQALATHRLKEGEVNVSISYTEKDYGSYQYQLRVRRT